MTSDLLNHAQDDLEAARARKEIVEAENPNRFQEKALRLVADDFNLAFKLDLKPSDFYVVWFSKTLQNWKALVSTDMFSGYYFEVTYNGDRLETYIDTYNKQRNIAIPDEVSLPVPVAAPYDR
jgi:hypothetical protein